MAAKQSAEMKEALSLVAGGTSVRSASNMSGVWFTSIYQAIKAQGHTVKTLREEYARQLKQAAKKKKK